MILASSKTGKRASQCTHGETLRQPDGNFAFALPERCGGKVFHMVACYKHLGTSVTRACCDAKDAWFKSQNAMSAYVKPWYTVLHRGHKLHCVHLSVMSRALFNAHLWVVDSRVLATANRVHDRVLRRVAGSPVSPGRWASQEAYNRDPQGIWRTVDGLHLVPKRREYLGRLVMLRYTLLWRLLQLSVHRLPIPWTRQCQEDLVAAVSLSPTLVAELKMHKSACSNADAFLDIATRSPDLSGQIECHFVESILDKRAEPTRAAVLRPFECDVCKVAFSTSKARDPQCKSAHGHNAEI